MIGNGTRIEQQKKKKDPERNEDQAINLLKEKEWDP